MKKILIIHLLFFSYLYSFSQTDSSIFYPKGFKKYIIIKPTGNFEKNLPEMVILDENSSDYKKISNSIANSFIKETIDLYILAQNYLKNNGVIQDIEPAYLALTKNQGGFAYTGFYLMQNNTLIDKSKTNYVDLHESVLNRSENELMSITQLYPHELGHVFLKMFSSSNVKEYKSKNIQIHYFGIVTDYQTAFNEGFAEHWENTSRDNENNKVIKEGIFESVSIAKNKITQYFDGYTNDFKWPLRLDYYRATMLFWFQRLENLKRYELVKNGKIKYKNHSISFSEPEETILYRNTGLFQNENQIRNYVQVLCTEGCISTFFTNMIESNLKNNYSDTCFYKQFLYSKNKYIPNLKQKFTPLQNQYLKIFATLFSFVKIDNPDKNPFIDFFTGYTTLFPEDADSLKKIFKRTTTYDFTENVPKELWILVKNVKHSNWVMDQFEISPMPIHTFDLNTAEVEDLITIKGVSVEEAEKIINYRNQKGFFNKFEEIKKIPGVSGVTAERIMLCEFDLNYFEKLPATERSFFKIILVSILHLLLIALPYFAVIFIAFYFFIYRKEKMSVKNIIIRFLIKFIYLCIFLGLGLISVILSSHPLLTFLIILAIVFGINWFVYRKKTKMLKEIFITTAAFGIVIIYSII